MIALYLLAAHLVGDFVLQTRWQAAGKLDDPWIRMRHVDAYIVPFLPLVVWRCWGNGEGWHAARGIAFMVALYVLHFATDSRRFRSTIGDWIGWRFASPEQRADAHKVLDSVGLSIPPTPFYRRPPPDVDRELPLPPNPWSPIPILIDQTLHVCQLALLGGLFLT